MTSTEQWKQYLADVAPEVDADTWIDPQNLRLPGAIASVPGVETCLSDHNKKIEESIRVHLKASEDAAACVSKEVRFLKMRWDYVMCYGAGNFLDFDGLDGKICMLNGPNASGKSSIIDVICIGLFGHPTNMRNMQHCKKAYGKLVFDQKPASCPMVVSILLNVDKDVFEITRSVNANGKDKTAIAKCLTNPAESVDGLTAVDTWVHGIIGSLDDVLMSNIVSQMDTDNFLYSKQEQQKEILDKTLRLNTITTFNKIIKESRIGHGAVIQAIKTAIAAIDGVLPSVDVSNMTKDISKMSDDVMQMRDDIAVLEKKRIELSIVVGNETDFTEPLDISSLKKKLGKAEKKLAEFADLTDADKDTSLLLKGEHYCKWNDLHEKLKLLGDADGNGDAVDIDSHLQDVQKRLDDIMCDKPKSCMSDSILMKSEKECTQWAKKQQQSYLDDPDMLQITRNELVGDIEYHKSLLATIMQDKPVKPVFIRKTQGDGDVVNIEELKEKQIELEDMEEELKAMKWDIERIQTYELPPGVAYGKWKREYDVWYEQIQDVLECEESLSDLENKYQQYLEYIQVIGSKLESQAALDIQLQELYNELTELGELPFNPECWACKKQPMRIRQVSVKEKSDSVAKALSKIKKYLSHAGDIDLKLKKSEAKAVKILIDKHGFYNATAERKNKEKSAWETYASLAGRIRKKEEKVERLREEVGNALWTVYSAWEKQYDTLDESITSMEVELTATNRFLDDAPHYIDLLNTVNDEKRLREEITVWEAEYALLQDTLNSVNRHKERMVLLAEINELKSVMDVNVTYMERIQSLTLAKQNHANIERAIAYVSLQEVCTSLTQLNNRYTEIQSRLLSRKREVSDIGSGTTTRVVCVDALALMEARYKDLSTLETKFVGDRSTSDGFREFMYTTRLIPQLQKNMNEFLSAFEEIQVNIGYTAKTFTFAVSDRGNCPMLDMASGYQRFIIGLAARAALAKMGAIGHNIKHLFIDEGFTSCDTLNITKASAVLRTLQTFVGYHNIILMSHSDAIKSCADTHVNIERVFEGGEGDAKVEVSSLKWGAAYPASPVKDDIQKKPKKTKKSVAAI